jgi:hypothetical protein
MGGISMGRMAEMKFDLDMSSPRGRHSIGKHGDACEHGHIITKEEIKKICNNYNLNEENYTIGSRTYKFLSMFNENNDDTILVINCGNGKLHVLDANYMPDGLIWPLNLYHLFKNQNINFVVIWISYELPWNDPYVITKNLHKKILNSNITYEPIPTTPLNLAIYLKDLPNILSFVNNKFKHKKLWLQGSCAGAAMISKYHNYYELENNLYHGIILCNPHVGMNQKDVKKIFNFPVKKPILIIQHPGDTGSVIDKEISKKIIEESQNLHKKYVELNGGINEGLPAFSMGHHAFRGVEDLYFKEVMNFINEDKQF